MEEFWEQSFKDNQRMWGEEPAEVTLDVNSLFQKNDIKNVLIPGFGYGRNAKVFIDHGIDVTGIEISKTAIAIADKNIQASYKIHHGSIVDMPFDTRTYQGIYCYALIHLLNKNERVKLIRDCYNQLDDNGIMVFVALSTNDMRYGKGEEIGKNNFLTKHGVTLFFYDTDAIEEEFGLYGLYDVKEINEPFTVADKPPQKFWKISCRKNNGR